MTTSAFIPQARDDIDAAYAYYESRQSGLGDRFLDELRRVIGLIEGNPRMYGEVIDGVRAAALRRFPYVVYYQEQPNQVLVIAVRHGHEGAAVWQARVQPP